MLFRKNLEAMPGWMKSFFEILVDRLREANKHINPVSAKDVSRQVIFLVNHQMKGQEPDMFDHVALPWKPLVKDTAFLINQPEEDVDRVMNKISLMPMAKSETNFEKGRQLVIEDIPQFEQFAEFCRARFIEKQGGEMPPQYETMDEREIKFLEFLRLVAREQGPDNEIELHYLETRLAEELQATLDEYKLEIKSMKRKQVLSSKLSADDVKSYVIDRQRIDTMLAMESTLEEFKTLEHKI
jgi:hypothetical protein